MLLFDTEAVSRPGIQVRQSRGLSTIWLGDRVEFVKEFDDARVIGWAFEEGMCVREGVLQIIPWSYAEVAAWRRWRRLKDAWRALRGRELDAAVRFHITNCQVMNKPQPGVCKPGGDA